MIDDNPHTDTPYITAGLFVLTIVLCMWITIDPIHHAALFQQGSFWPGTGFGRRRLFREAVSIHRMTPENRIITVTIFHSFFNIFALAVFGDNVEYAMGRGRYIIFILIAAVMTMFAQFCLQSGSHNLQIGIGGIVAAIMGAYVWIFPGQDIIMGWGYNLPNRLWRWNLDDDGFRINVMFLVGFFFLLNLAFAFIMSRHPNGLSYWAQVSGFVIGYILARFFRDPTVSLEEALPYIPEKDTRWDYLKTLKGKPMPYQKYKYQDYAIQADDTPLTLEDDQAANEVTDSR